MQFNFTGRNVDVTPALKATAQEKLQHLERRHSKITQVHVTFHIEHLTHIVEVNLHVNGTEIHATGKGVDMYASIDEVVEKLARQLTKLKEKEDNH